MRAKVIHATMDPRRIPMAAEAVRSELGPQFLSHPGARHGYWMADRSTGHLLAVTIWDSDEHLQASAAIDGEQRAVVAGRIGMRVLAVQNLEVFGAQEEPMSSQPQLRWARATWVDGLVPDVRGQLSGLYHEAVPDQARSRGFCASYWLGDLSTRSGLGLSFWEGPAELTDSEMRSRRRRGRFEELLGCTIGAVAEYEALGVAGPLRSPATTGEVSSRVAAATLSLSRSAGPARRRHAGGGAATAVAPLPQPLIAAEADGLVAAAEPSPTMELVQQLSQRAGLGTTLERPPGALLAVRGDRSCQVIVLLDGRAAVVHHDDVVPALRGSHFGAHTVVEGRASARTVLATSPVRVHVLSRTEFAAVTDYLPSVAQDLLAHDLDR